MERRTALGGIAAATVGALAPAAVAKLAFGESAADAPRGTDYQTATIKTSDNTVFIRRYGQGPAMLLVHGFPRTSLMWRYVAPRFAKNYTVICVDLRGYGGSGSPASTDDHRPYSKRAMANELVEVMDKLGFSKFTVIGHDRGGRVSARLALDHPERVERLAVFDVIQSSDGWARANAQFALTYWPWVLLAQKAPLPETYLTKAPEAAFGNPFGEGSFGPKIRDEYLQTFRDPVRIHAICEEYRAAATIDVGIDDADRKAGRRITCPMLHLWAAGGTLEQLYGPQGSLAIWRTWADNVQGQSVTGGHFFPEENPDETTDLLNKFFVSA
jgi:haloacetate dehalogenase